MSFEKELIARSESKCELCSSTLELAVYEVAPKGDDISECGYLCATCREQLEDHGNEDSNHWRCLNESMWSEVPAIQVLSWRMLTRLKNEGWPNDLLEMMYLEEDTMVWAKAGGQAKIKHIDSNGTVLEAGDSVVLIKDLKVKGSSMIAKRGTSVRRITLVHDNANHIEGKVEDQRIVILTEFVKKVK